MKNPCHMFVEFICFYFSKMAVGLSLRKFIIALKSSRSVKTEKVYHNTIKAKGWCSIGVADYYWLSNALGDRDFSQGSKNVSRLRFFVTLQLLV